MANVGSFPRLRAELIGEKITVRAMSRSQRDDRLAASVALMSVRTRNDHCGRRIGRSRSGVRCYRLVGIASLSSSDDGQG